MRHSATRRFWRGGLLCVIAVALGGCSSATKQMLPQVVDERPTADKALIVVERGYGWVGSARSWKVYDNRTLVGELGTGGKLAWLREPGTADIQFDGSDRYTEPMGTIIQSIAISTGRSITAAAGKTYHFKTVQGDGSFDVDGPGVPLNPLANLHYTRARADDPLVLFRLLPKESSGTLLLIDLATNKNISLAVNPAGRVDPWLALYLAPGQYNLATYTVKKTMGTVTAISEYKINAEFTLTKGNNAVYAGDLVLVKDTLCLIRKDSAAARAFVEQNGRELTFTESLMEFNE